MSNKAKVIMYLCFILIFTLGIVLYATTSPSGDVVVIESDGKIIEKINLLTITEDYEITVENNGYNVIKISNNGVKVTEANCPDKLCIEQSKKGIYPIICLPHKLIIDKSENHQY